MPARTTHGLPRAPSGPAASQYSGKIGAREGRFASVYNPRKSSLLINVNVPAIPGERFHGYKPRHDNCKIP